MPLAVDWVTDAQGFGALADEWDALLPGDARPFDLHCWYASWWEAFGGSSKLAVCTVRRRGKLVGVLPMQFEGRRLKGLVNSHSGVFRPLATDREAMETLVAAALARPASEVELLLLPSKDSSLAMLEEGARNAGKLLLPERGSVSPIVESAGDLDAWRKGTKSSWKARLARYRRKMQRDHDATFEIVAAPDDLEAWLEEGFRIEASGWKEQAGTAIVSAPETAAFYRDVARRFHERDELRLSRIVLDGSAVAFSFCILGGDKLYSLKTGYDERLRKLVPGLVMQLSIIERCFELGLVAYELLGEMSDWKEKLATGSQSHTNLRIYPRRPSGALRYAYRANLRPLLRTAYRRLRPRRR